MGKPTAAPDPPQHPDSVLGGDRILQWRRVQHSPHLHQPTWRASDSIDFSGHASDPQDGTLPETSLSWSLILHHFSGHASDPQDGTLPETSLSWSLILHHCATPSDCHAHAVQDFNGVASGTLSAPDHKYPAWIELQLTATDSGGLTGTATVRLDPQSVAFTFRSNPTGLQLTVGSTVSTTEFSRTVIVGSRNTIAAPRLSPAQAEPMCACNA